MLNRKGIKIKLLISIFLVLIIILAGCDSNGLNGEDVRNYEVNLIIDGITEETVDDLRIVAEDTYDQLDEYLEDNIIEITLNLSNSGKIEILHPNLLFDPDIISVTEDDDNSVYLIYAGKSVNDLEELNNILAEGILPLVLLNSDIDLNGEVADLDINRNILINGNNQFGFIGDGSIKIGETDSISLEYDISFIDLYFKPETPVEISEVAGHDTYMYITGSGNYTFFNIEVIVEENYANRDNILESFLRISLDSEGFLTSIYSAYDLGDIIAFDMDNGFNSYLSNNNFIGEPRWYIMRTTNSPDPARMTLINNDFTEVEARSDESIVGTIFELQTNWHQENHITFNEIYLLPVDDHDNQNEINDFFEIANEIHKEFAEKNIVSDDYATSYVYGENLDPDIRGILEGYKD